MTPMAALSERHWTAVCECRSCCLVAAERVHRAKSCWTCRSPLPWAGTAWPPFSLNHLVMSGCMAVMVSPAGAGGPLNTPEGSTPIEEFFRLLQIYRAEST